MNPAHAARLAELEAQLGMRSKPAEHDAERQQATDELLAEATRRIQTRLDGIVELPAEDAIAQLELWADQMRHARKGGLSNGRRPLV